MLLLLLLLLLILLLLQSNSSASLNDMAIARSNSLACLAMSNS